MRRLACLAGVAVAFAVALALPPRHLLAQEPFEARNAFYLEMGGNALLYSVNYERLLLVGSTGGGLGVRVGVGAIPLWFPFVDDDEADGGEGAAVFFVPATVNFVFGPGNHHYEVGLGATYANASVDIGSWEGSENGVFGTGTVGYRYQRPDGGVVFRAGFTPVFGGNGELEFFPMFGLSIGKSF